MLAELGSPQVRFRTLIGIDRYLEVRQALGIAGIELTEPAELERLHLVEEAVVLDLREAHCRCDLQIVGLALQFVAKRADRRIEIAPHFPERSRCPVKVTQRIQHRTMYPAPGERVKRNARRRFVARSGVHQAEHANADKVGQFDLRRQALGQTLCQRLHQA